MKTPAVEFEKFTGELLVERRETDDSYPPFEIDFDFSCCPESGNLHLFFTEELLADIDRAMLLRGIKTREDFGTICVLYVLDQLENGAGVADELSSESQI